jgi:ABC-type sulfate/molybdate transport systems ATPase subunit
LIDGPVLRSKRITTLDWSGQPPLEVGAGELFVLVGKPGAGKSALARIIVGLDPIDEGELRVDEVLINNMSPAERGIGIVFQEDGLWQHWTVAENIAFGLKCRGIGHQTQRLRVDELLVGMHLDGLASRKPAQLTALQRWRVALARCLVLEPKVLIIDEPFAVEDAAETSTIATEIRRVHQEYGLTTLLLTRHAVEAVPIADQIGFMSVGGVVQAGKPADLYSRPCSREVAELFGQVNVIAGQIESVDPRGETVMRSRVGRLIGRCRAETLGAGSSALGLVRPESITISSTGGSGANRFQATVVRRSVRGPLCFVELVGPSDWSGTVLLMRNASHTVRDGQTLSVGITPEAVFVVPGAAEA